VENITALKNLNRKNISDQVFEQMLGRITYSTWKPGEKLPSENELAEIMGVSRISIREAIKRLAAMDLVETYRGKGTFVKEFTTSNYLKSLTPMLLLSKQDVKYVLQYRRILDLGIIDLYMDKVKKRDINRLEKDLDKMVHHKDNLSLYQKYDLDFHVALYEMTGNPIIVKITNMIRDILSSAMGFTITEEGAEEGIEYHGRILKSIKEKDTDTLRITVSELFDKIEEEFNEAQAEEAQKAQEKLKEQPTVK